MHGSVFDKEADSHQGWDSAEINPKNIRKKGFDRSITVRSNWGLMFVCNKSATPGWAM
jgi:hypothetical protein